MTSERPLASTTPLPLWRIPEDFVTPTQASARLRWSWVFLFAGCAFGLLMTMSAMFEPPPGVANGSSPLSHAEVVRNFLLVVTPVLTYIFWGAYWGYVALWTTSRYNRDVLGIKRKIQWFNPFMWGAILFIYLMLMPMVAFFYGCFGGGILQYRRHRRILSGHR